MQANLRKEWLDGIRNYRFVIIVAGIWFFAIMNPLMTYYILPGLLRSQFPEFTEQMIESMLQMSQAEAMRTYLGDVFQIGILVAVFALASVMASEIKEKTLIFPLTMGKSYGPLVYAKMIIYGSALLVVSTTGVLINYYYTGVLFGFELDSVVPALRSGFLLGFYMVFVLSMLLLFGVIFKKPMLAAFATLLPAWFLQPIGNLLKINRFLPSGLVTQMNELSQQAPADVWMTMVLTALVIVLLLWLTTIRLRTMELMGG